VVTAARRTRLTGLGAGVGAGLLWGLAFLLPELLHGWSAVTVTAGRYLVYALLALVVVAVSGPALRALARRHWRPAVQFAITGNVGYYLLLVLAVQAVGAPVTGIIIGSIPVTLAVVGNIVARTYPWRRLIAPVALVAVGLAIVNVLEMGGSSPQAGASLGSKAFGVLCAFGAVALWTWYGIANARFLERHPDVPDAGWSTVVGLATGAVALLALPLAAVTRQLGGSGTGAGDVRALLITSLILGVAVSWGGTALWNAASGRLPPTAAGMLINVETMSGFAYVYAARGQWPPVGQLLGFACILAGVAVVMRLQTRAAVSRPAG
jgi:drug/metabolite transporter (DMT)-like permease